MSRKRSNYVGLYGNIALEKGKCEKCDTTAFILDGRFACCGEWVEEFPDRYKRESEAEQRRRRPRVEDIRSVLELQEDACIYCGIKFGKHVIRRGRAIKLVINCDHFIPYSFTQNNYPFNFVMSCQLCNGIKSNLCFQDIDEARIYILDKRIEKGII